VGRVDELDEEADERHRQHMDAALFDSVIDIENEPLQGKKAGGV